MTYTTFVVGGHVLAGGVQFSYCRSTRSWYLPWGIIVVENAMGGVRLWPVGAVCYWLSDDGVCDRCDRKEDGETS